MEIVIDNYVLVPEQGSVNRFTLTEKVTRQKKDSDETYDGSNDLLYSVTLERCIEYIIHNKLIENTEQVTLKQFIEHYKQIKLEILKTLNP